MDTAWVLPPLSAIAWPHSPSHVQTLPYSSRYCAWQGGPWLVRGCVAMISSSCVGLGRADIGTAELLGLLITIGSSPLFLETSLLKIWCNPSTVKPASSLIFSALYHRLRGSYYRAHCAGQRPPTFGIDHPRPILQNRLLPQGHNEPGWTLTVLLSLDYRHSL